MREALCRVSGKPPEGAPKTPYLVFSYRLIQDVGFLFCFLRRFLYNFPRKSAEKVSNWCQIKALFGVKQPAHAVGNAFDVVSLCVGIHVLRHFQ